MPSTERTCPQCLQQIVVVTDDRIGEKQEGHCPHCGIKIVFERRTTFGTNAPVAGGQVVNIHRAG